MSNKIILVTGATDGIGKLVATDLAKQQKENTVIIHGRNREKLEQAGSDIKRISGNPNIETQLSDFSSLASVRSCAENILSKHSMLDLLINNAGAGFAAPQYGLDGTETRFTVNYLAPFLLTRLLIPALLKSSSARIVNVASAGQSAIDFSDIQMEKKFDGVTAYTRSKLAIIMFTMDLAEELQSKGITVNSLHPGSYLDTGMVREAGVQPLGTAQSGADAVIYLATSPDLNQVTGKYFNVKKESKVHAQAYDIDARKSLREFGILLTR